MGLLNMEMDVTPERAVIYIVVSSFQMAGVSYFNTWPFSTREKAQEFIDSGAGDANTDLDGFMSDRDAYKIREEVLDEQR